VAPAEPVPVPDWIHPGAEVAEFTYGHTSRDVRVELATVTKVGKRDVVLANGARYNVTRLWRSTGTWSSTWYLRRRDDKDVVRALDGMRRRLTLSKVEEALKGWEETGSLSDLRGAIAALSAHLPT
jgi:hypothetical protein